MHEVIDAGMPTLEGPARSTSDVDMSPKPRLDGSVEPQVEKGARTLPGSALRFGHGASLDVPSDLHVGCGVGCSRRDRGCGAHP